MSVLAPFLQSLARLIFGFLVSRHGMERAFGFPEASDAVGAYEQFAEWVALPGGVLMMLGLFTRPAGLVLSLVYFGLYVAVPLQTGWWPHRNGGDPVLLNAFFFLFIAAAGGGALSLDRLRDPQGEAASDRRWAPQAQRALGLLRMAAGVLFMFHGWEKWFGIGGGNGDINLNTVRGFAGLLETVGGPLISLGLFTRVVAFVLSGQMAVAYFTTWAPRGFWASFSGAGMEASILFSFLYLFLWSAGPGAWSLDAALARRSTDR
ncbi:MAG: DoxX family protein [Vicinamibacterales bacterium]